MSLTGFTILKTVWLLKASSTRIHFHLVRGLSSEGTGTITILPWSRAASMFLWREMPIELLASPEETRRKTRTNHYGDPEEESPALQKGRIVLHRIVAWERGELPLRFGVSTNLLDDNMPLPLRRLSGMHHNSQGLFLESVLDHVL